MNIAGYAIRQKAVTMVFTVLIIVGGLMSYQSVGRLEDPEFTIKEAVITTQYPGATAQEVEKEVSEKLETAIQQLKQLEEVRSISRPGLSIIYAEMQDKYDKDTLPQVWDELRRKINAAAADLPPGCETPSINDDFGDVYGIFFAISGDGYSYHDLKAFADDLRRELLLCDQVGRIDFWGTQTEVVYVEMDRARIARLGLTPTAIFNTISLQNEVVDSGDVTLDENDMRFRVTGGFTDVKDLENVLVSSSAGRMIRIKDVAKVERGYYDPPTSLMFRSVQNKNKKLDARNPGIGFGISVVTGGNVVKMGEAVRARLNELQTQVPVGISVDPIAFQSETVQEAVDGFVWNLIEAVAIVVLLLVIFMGFREGVIIGVILLLTILATFIGMNVLDVSLQRISLGALIIALGMLVDNAIVVAEGIVIKSHSGLTRKQAAEEAVHETQWPLLGATTIAVLAFAAISISKDVTGEFLGSLFTVIALSLFLSWVFAITVTPWLCVTFLPDLSHEPIDPHNNWFYNIYRWFLRFCIHHKPITIAAVAGLLLLAMFGFQFVEKNFFSDSTRRQFLVNMWMPEGTSIQTTKDRIKLVEDTIQKHKGVTGMTSFVGQGAMRFILTYSPEMINTGYAVILIDVDDYHIIKPMLPGLQHELEQLMPDGVFKVEAFKLGPGGGAVEARLMGPETETLRDLSKQVLKIMRDEPNACSIRTDWGDPIKVAAVNMAESRSRNVGITRTDIGQSLKMNFDGMVAGTYREDDKLLPIILRLPEQQRTKIGSLEDVQVWGSAASGVVPITQVTDHVETRFEDPVIRRKNRIRTITVTCQQRTGMADTLFQKMRGKIEAISLPVGYHLEWGGEYENSTDANRKLMSKVPLAFSLMFCVTVMLFNTLRHPIIIFLGLPLALIGVTGGLLFSGQPFGFMATLGFLSLAGMLIKNEIVLLDQINLDLASGKPAHKAVIDSAVSRVRPVSMAAFTTVFGMIPLITDAFFAPMAVTIMAGLTFATVLTLIVVPVLYAAFFKVSFAD